MANPTGSQLLELASLLTYYVCNTISEQLSDIGFQSIISPNLHNDVQCLNISNDFHQFKRTISYFKTTPEFPFLVEDSIAVNFLLMDKGYTLYIHWPTLAGDILLKDIPIVELNSSGFSSFFNWLKPSPAMAAYKEARKMLFNIDTCTELNSSIKEKVSTIFEP